MENPVTAAVENKIEEKRKEKKDSSSSGSLPLMMFLEVDGIFPSVFPDCPNASNPFHKCSNYCWDKIGSQSKDLTLLSRQTKSADHDGYSVDKGNHRSTTRSYASTSSGTNSLMGSENGGAAKAILEKESRETKKAEKTRILYPDCVYASNPFHECTDHCRQKVAERDHPKKSLSGNKVMEKKTSWKLPVKLAKSNSEPGVNQANRAGSKKKHANIERWNVHPDCIHASNAYHTCVEECFQRIREMSYTKQKPSKKDKSLERNLNTDPKCPYASNPFHKCTDYCFQNNYESTLTERVKTKKEPDKSTAQVARTDARNLPDDRSQRLNEEDKTVEESSDEDLSEDFKDMNVQEEGLYHVFFGSRSKKISEKPQIAEVSSSSKDEESNGIEHSSEKIVDECDVRSNSR